MRSDVDDYFLKLAKLTATRTTCLRRAVGCVLVDESNRVLATGYNGTPRGFPHCNEGHPCPGATAPSGQALDSCYSVHAEQNALLQCGDVNRIRTCYVTVSPCVTCVKLLLNTGCQRIVFAERYAHDEAARALWQLVFVGQFISRTWKLLAAERDGTEEADNETDGRADSSPA